VIEDSFLKTYDRKRLIWYMGSGKKVTIKKEVEVIGNGCFVSCQSLREVVFEEGSKLRLIENSMFGSSCVTRIVIPAGAVIEKDCFRYCPSGCELIFEE
jgi:hypothetical protein